MSKHSGENILLIKINRFVYKCFKVLGAERTVVVLMEHDVKLAFLAFFVEKLVNYTFIESHFQCRVVFNKYVVRCTVIHVDADISGVLAHTLVMSEPAEQLGCIKNSLFVEPDDHGSAVNTFCVNDLKRIVGSHRAGRKRRGKQRAKQQNTYCNLTSFLIHIFLL